MKTTIFFYLMAVLSIPSLASAVTIDPDDYIEGELMSNISPHVSIGITGGGDVYAATYQNLARENPPGFVSSGPIGDQVFSAASDRNTEWMASELQYSYNDINTVSNLQSSLGGLLLFDFQQTVSWVSILSMEYLSDAGWGTGSDPLVIFLYDSNGNLINSMEGENNKTSLPTSDSYPEPYSPYAYFLNEFSAPDIGYLAIGGFSEPTTIDRLEFQFANVPEPPTVLLMLMGLSILTIRQRKTSLLP